MPEEMSRPLDFLECDQVPGGDGLGEVAALQPPAFAGHLVGQHRGQALADRLLDPPGDGGLAGKCFHAPPAPQPQRGPPALTIMCPISPALPVAPLDDLAAANHAAADPGADERGDHVAITSPDPEPKLGVAGDPHVVPHQHRPAERCGRAQAPSGKFRTFMFALKRIVPVLTSSGPGDPMPAPAISPRDKPADSSASSTHVDDRRDDRGTAFLGRRRSLGTTENPMVAADHAHQDLGSSQVDPQHGGPSFREVMGTASESKHTESIFASGSVYYSADS